MLMIYNFSILMKIQFIDIITDLLKRIFCN